ncbi:HAD family hydrolase [Streptomyces sp. NPDC088116]|uniref:HAD family hydrolase n=1 Tax=Streptomyces sp. NPDC088116 TaxID=3365825 RepID=UPI0038309B59
MTSAPITTVVVDYGGVMTNPLDETFAAFADAVGVPVTALQDAFAKATARHGRSPMADLETGDCTESEMVERVLAELPDSALPGGGGPDSAGPGGVALKSPAGAGTVRRGLDLLGGREFGELWFRARTVDEQMVCFLRSLRRFGYRTALLTNNVAEWGPRWRAQLPVDELFDLVVDSSQEGVRKPDPLIYRRLLDRLPASPRECLFLDDLEENCAAASGLGMLAVRFTTADEAIDQVVALLRSRGTYQVRNRV